ncbi:MAG: ATP-dependent metallopeptidase FtsH/Yme1/Tma family protein, partial [Rhizobiales bacterium]|nr:ATP-dependent metallopeptidase FtsH/Yme1/Tma family protein [Hyphomicrobiales bacterium]
MSARRPAAAEAARNGNQTRSSWGAVPVRGGESGYDVAETRRFPGAAVRRFPWQRAASTDISFSQLLTEVDAGKVRDVLIQGPEIHGTFTDGRSFQTYAPNDPSLIQRLYGKGVSITARPQG